MVALRVGTRDLKWVTWTLYVTYVIVGSKRYTIAVTHVPEKCGNNVTQETRLASIFTPTTLSLMYVYILTTDHSMKAVTKSMESLFLSHNYTDFVFLPFFNFPFPDSLQIWTNGGWMYCKLITSVWDLILQSFYFMCILLFLSRNINQICVSEVVIYPQPTPQQKTYPHV